MPIFHEIDTFLVKYQYKLTRNSKLNIKLSDSQLDKLKVATKNYTGLIIRLSSKIIWTKDETNFMHKLLLTVR